MDELPNAEMNKAFIEKLNAEVNEMANEQLSSNGKVDLEKIWLYVRKRLGFDQSLDCFDDIPYTEIVPHKE